MAPFVPGVRRFDTAGATRAAVQRAVDAVQRATVLFLKGSSRPAPGQEQVIAELVQGVEELAALAEAAGLRFHLEIVGHTDEDGLPESNLPLSRNRAEVLRAAVAAALNDRLEIATAGVGSAQPTSQGRTEEDMQRNRRAQVRVTPLG
jgi:OOP family OmpA-OmpF porin